MSSLQVDCLKVLPMTREMVDDRFREGGLIVRTICLSHERLRAELSGAEIVISDLQAEVNRLESIIKRITKSHRSESTT